MTEGSQTTSEGINTLSEAPAADIPEGMYRTPRGEIITHQEGYNRFMKEYGHLVNGR